MFLHCKAGEHWPAAAASPAPPQIPASEATGTWWFEPDMALVPLWPQFNAVFPVSSISSLAGRWGCCGWWFPRFRWPPPLGSEVPTSRGSSRTRRRADRLRTARASLDTSDCACAMAGRTLNQRVNPRWNVFHGCMTIVRSTDPEHTG